MVVRLCSTALGLPLGLAFHISANEKNWTGAAGASSSGMKGFLIPFKMQRARGNVGRDPSRLILATEPPMKGSEVIGRLTEFVLNGDRAE
jgi:hypothetical protein